MACLPNETMVDGWCIENGCVVTLGTTLTECAENGYCVDDECFCNDEIFNAADQCKTCTEDPNLNASASRPCTQCIANFTRITLPDGSKLCTQTNCIAEDNTICNNNGTCEESGCVCTDPAADPTNFCFKCPEGETAISGKCVNTKCIKNGVVCGGNGGCSKEGVCGCIYNTKGEFCEDCVDGFAKVEKTNKCLVQACVMDQMECSDSGTCEKDVCNCINGKSGNYCQCDKGFKQESESKQTCLKNNCISGSDECMGQGKCILKNNEFQCQDCGSNLFNDPSKGCGACLPGASFYDGQYVICTSDKCLDDYKDEICTGNGNCVMIANEAQCSCKSGLIGNLCDICENDPNMFPQGCKKCFTGYDIQNGKCVPTNCFKDGIECFGRGLCDIKKLECVCFSDLMTSTCEECIRNNANPINLCEDCVEGFVMIDTSCYSTACQEGYIFDYDHRFCVEKTIDVPTKSLNVGMIVGIVIGVILLIVAIIVAVVCIKKKNSQKQIQEKIQMKSHLDDAKTQ